MLSKADYRLLKKKQRACFPRALSSLYDRKIQEHLSPLLTDAKIISCYVSMGDEISTRDLLVSLSKKGPLLIPKVVGSDLAMGLFTSFDDLKLGPWNILEPQNLSLLEPDLVIVPLLAFNQKGYRIGYGKGYYDRYLKDRTCMKVGLAYEWMQEDFLEDEFDIGLDWVVTEKRCISF